MFRHTSSLSGPDKVNPHKRVKMINHKQQLLDDSPELRPDFPSERTPTGSCPDGVKPFRASTLSRSALQRGIVDAVINSSSPSLFPSASIIASLLPPSLLASVLPLSFLPPSLPLSFLPPSLPPCFLPPSLLASSFIQYI